MQARIGQFYFWERARQFLTNRRTCTTLSSGPDELRGGTRIPLNPYLFFFFFVVFNYKTGPVCSADISLRLYSTRTAIQGSFGSASWFIQAALKIIAGTISGQPAWHRFVIFVNENLTLLFGHARALFSPLLTHLTRYILYIRTSTDIREKHVTEFFVNRSTDLLVERICGERSRYHKWNYQLELFWQTWRVSHFCYYENMETFLVNRSIFWGFECSYECFSFEKYYSSSSIIN